MKKLLTLLAVGSIAFGVVSAAAATLGTTTSNGLAAGTTVVAACNAGGTAVVSYTTSYYTTGGYYKIDNVVVTLGTAGCDTKAAKATLTSATDGTSVLGSEVSTTVSTTVATFNFSSQNLSAASLQFVAISITG